MIKTIIFDCFGVLTTDLWGAFLARLPQGADLEPLRGLNRAFDAGIITAAEYTGGIKELTGLEPPVIDDVTGLTKNEPLLNYIRDLRARGYVIGMLSNISSNWVRKEFLTEADQKLFDDMVFSFEAGVSKPNPQIYQLACSRLQTEPENAVFIDDAPGNCAAAEAEGMTAIVYTDFQNMKSQLETLLH